MAGKLSERVFRRLTVTIFLPSPRHLVPKRTLLYAVNMDPITANLVIVRSRRKELPESTGAKNCTFLVPHPDLSQADCFATNSPTLHDFRPRDSGF